MYYNCAQCVTRVVDTCMYIPDTLFTAVCRPRDRHERRAIGSKELPAAIQIQLRSWRDWSRLTVPSCRRCFHCKLAQYCQMKDCSQLHNHCTNRVCASVHVCIMDRRTTHCWYWESLPAQLVTFKLEYYSKPYSDGFGPYFVCDMVSYGYMVCMLQAGEGVCFKDDQLNHLRQPEGQLFEEVIGKLAGENMAGNSRAFSFQPYTR